MYYVCNYVVKRFSKFFKDNAENGEIYWITKCTTTGYFLTLFLFPPKKMRGEEKENEVAKPVYFRIQSIFTQKRINNINKCTLIY